ncbi:phosphatidylserine/phosphatidylglycerophosphate/cardiolipin synthase family protein [Candidatus Roizmanbacteria bacterium]|nr:phosphatidylserine/phosphatidylglycerophosphate/cardiolipin synthase family protein [Candidatus Roizmanbacteria bacterium]
MSENPKFRALSQPSRLKSPDMYNPLHPSFFNADRPAPKKSSSGSNHFEVIPTSNLFFQDLEEQIGRARTSVDLQFYTLESDEKVLQIMNAAMAAAKRGVSVRVLVDHTASDPRQFLPTALTFKRANSIPNMTVKQARATGKLENPLSRNHKKIVVIDGENEEGVAYIGGINLAERSLYWNDFMVKLHGSVAALVQGDFDASWDGKNSQAKVLPDDEQGTYLLTDSQQDETIVDFALDKIAHATQRVWLETPYLDASGIGAALIQAKKDNPALDVKLIVPRYNNYPVHRLMVDHMLDPFAKSDIETYKYGKTYRRLNHTKLLLVDDAVMFGSSNFNSSHLAGNNADIEISTQNAGILGQLERWYQEDMQESVIYPSK